VASASAASASAARASGAETSAAEFSGARTGATQASGRETSGPEAGGLKAGAADSVGARAATQFALQNSPTTATQSGVEIVVVTFEPHPLTVLRPEAAPPRLTTPETKRRLLAEAGVDRLVVLAPTPDVLGLSAEQFWAILRDQVRPSHIVAGFNFNFGKGRGGSVRDMQEWSAGTGIQVHVEPPMEAALVGMQIVPVSSSLIRWLLVHGRVRDAAICLGRPYALHGAVARGFGRGRTIGVPTANIRHDGQLVPADGVYAARCFVVGIGGGAGDGVIGGERTITGSDGVAGDVGGTGDGVRVYGEGIAGERGSTGDGPAGVVAYPAAVSIGNLPTFGDDVKQVEAHLIGFDGDLYDRILAIEFIDWIRDQRKFPGIDALKSQIAIDVETAKSLADRNPAKPIAMLDPSK
jgi:riboflavin kinase/FMN adenylyltransferase